MLVQTDRFGTSVAKALRTHANVSRTKRRQRAEERAAKLGVKLAFPLVFFLFPAMYVVVPGPAIIKLMQSLLYAADDERTRQRRANDGYDNDNHGRGGGGGSGSVPVPAPGASVEGRLVRRAGASLVRLSVLAALGCAACAGGHSGNRYIRKAGSGPVEVLERPLPAASVPPDAVRKAVAQAQAGRPPPAPSPTIESAPGELRQALA